MALLHLVARMGEWFELGHDVAPLLVGENLPALGGNPRDRFADAAGLYDGQTQPLISLSLQRSLKTTTGTKELSGRPR